MIKLYVVVVCEHSGCWTENVELKWQTCIEFPWHCRIRLFNGSFVIDLTSGLSGRGPELILLLCRWTVCNLQLDHVVWSHARIRTKKEIPFKIAAFWRWRWTFRQYETPNGWPWKSADSFSEETVHAAMKNASLHIHPRAAKLKMGELLPALTHWR